MDVFPPCFNDYRSCLGANDREFRRDMGLSAANVYHLCPPIVVLFLVGVFYPRGNGQGAFMTLTLGTL